MTKVGLAVHRTFHSLHTRNFRLFFLGQAVSVTGTWMQAVAAAWLVLQLTGSGVALGIETALTFAPILFIGGWAGGMADRHDKRKILIATQVAFAVLALAFWGTVATGVVQLWMVYALSLLQGVVTAVDTPTRQSFYVEMVGPKDLTNAVSLNSAVMTGTRIIGPGARGGAHRRGRARVVLLPERHLVHRGHRRVVRDAGARPAPARGAERRGPVPRGTAVRLVHTRAALADPAHGRVVHVRLQLLRPAAAPRGGHVPRRRRNLRFVAVADGRGLARGALAMARRNTPSPKRLALWAIGFGLVSVLSAFAPTLGAEMVVLVPLGLVAIAFMITANSTLQLTARPEMRGRVMAIYSVVFLGGTPIGAPIAGFIGEHLGPRVAIALGGLTAMAAGSIGLRALARLGTPSALGTDPEVVETPMATGVTEPDLAVDEALTV